MVEHRVFYFSLGKPPPAVTKELLLPPIAPGKGEGDPNYDGAPSRGPQPAPGDEGLKITGCLERAGRDSTPRTRVAGPAARNRRADPISALSGQLIPYLEDVT